MHQSSTGFNRLQQAGRKRFNKNQLEATKFNSVQQGLAPGSGPGGRWLKSIRPAILHLLPFQKLSVFSCRHQSINPQHYA
jgi:hypothetical protein